MEQLIAHTKLKYKLLDQVLCTWGATTPVCHDLVSPVIASQFAVAFITAILMYDPFIQAFIIYRVYKE